MRMDLSHLEVEINPEDTMMKKINKNLYLSKEQTDILDNYQINYKNYSSLSQLINEIESVYEETGDDILANLIDVLAERDYYQNYKK